jgi:hypothetical protein
MSDDMQLDELNPVESPTESNSQEEVEVPDEWKLLDGRSQDRFKKLAQQKREALERTQKLEEENARLKDQQHIPMPPTQNKFASEEEKLGFQRITELGVPTRDEMNKQIKEEVEAVQNRFYLDNQHDKMESDVNTKKELPAYDRAEIEDYMRRNGIWNPKTAYNELYHDEVVAYEAQQLLSKKKESPHTEKTRSRIGTSQPWTRESLAERLNQPDGIEFYKKNREKILRMQADLSRG